VRHGNEESAEDILVDAIQMAHAVRVVLAVISRLGDGVAK
jgi:hypothetical protein